jgi:hypothetical protein
MILVMWCRSTLVCEVKKKVKQISDYFKPVKGNGDFKVLMDVIVRSLPAGRQVLFHTLLKRTWQHVKIFELNIQSCRSGNRQVKLFLFFW